MKAARRRIRKALRRLRLTDEQTQLIRLLLREERRERDAVARLLADCRRELHAALAPPAPDSATVLELSMKERRLSERQLGLCDQLEERIARLLGPERAAELRTLPPVAQADEPATSPYRPAPPRFSALHAAPSRA